MKIKKFSIWINFTLLAAVFFAAVVPVSADGGDSIWDGVIDENGEILYDSLIDQGIHTEAVDWIPGTEILGQTLGGTAEYHIYETADGTVVKLPTATTLFFMALKPGESGIGDASASHFTGAGTMLSVPGVISALLQGANIDLSNTEYVSSDQYADALVAGETDIFSLGTGDLWNLMTGLAAASRDDFLGSGEFNLYTALFLYTPDNIPDELAELLPDDFTWDEVVLPPACPEGRVTQGVITRSGVLVAPNFPLVVGQDPDKRGVDLSFNASVAPTIWTYYEEVPVLDTVCKNLNGRPLTDSDCTRPNGLPGFKKEEVVDWVCEERTTVYPETIPVAYASATLSSDSRSWILDTLSIRYPGAYIHNGSFRYPSSAGGSSWNFERQDVQVQDPGTWILNISGRTSGTPVTASRNFGGEAGSFNAYLKETAIIQ